MTTQQAGKKEQLYYQKKQKMISCHFSVIWKTIDTQFTWQVVLE